MKKFLISILSVLTLTICAIGLVSCGRNEQTMHVCDFTKQVITDEYKQSDATCTEKASYYYSCECGKSGSTYFTYGRKLGHNMADGACVRCGALYSNGLEYELSDTESYYLVVGLGNCTDVDIIIPPTHHNLPVKSIGDGAFSHWNKLKHIELPDSIITIGDNAFSGCQRLESIMIPASVKSVGNLEGCRYLEDIYVAEDNENYKSLEGNLYSEDGKTLIKYAAAKRVTSFTIPNGVTTIGANAFYDSFFLEEITIPESVSSIGNNAFYTRFTLKNINVVENNANYKSVEGNLYSKDGTILIKYSRGKRLETFTIPNNVTTIGANAFSDDETLTNIIIPNSVIDIGSSAFQNCRLTSITFDEESCLTNIKERAFASCDILKSIEIPASVEVIEDWAFWCCYDLKTVKIPNGVTTIGANAFRNCGNLTSVEIPKSVISIGDCAFSVCYNLTSINVAEDNMFYKSIDGNLYSKDEKTLMQYAIGKNATHFVIPSSVMSIGNEAFEDCKSLNNIEIPNSVIRIGQWAFSNCNNLTSITYKGNTEEWNCIAKGWSWMDSNHTINIQCTNGEIKN